jgi:outer membrane biosynthesis protein TonB
VKLKLPEMKTGLAISALVHAALLVWGLISFAARPLDAKPMDALPIDIISDKDFDQMAKGVKNAPQAKTPSPLAEKVDTEKLVDDSSAKINEKKEIKSAKAEAPPPPPAPTPPPKPTEAKPDKKPPPKVDPIAETLKKEEARKRAEDKAKAKAEQQQKQQPQFDPNKIAALLDKREPQRMAAADNRMVQTPSLGFSGGQAVQLSQSEMTALRNRLSSCWRPPAGAAEVANLKVVVRVLFNPDGSVQGQPELVKAPASAYGPAMAESAIRALLTCQPFNMLRPTTYDRWRDMEITFDPKEMFGG